MQTKFEKVIVVTNGIIKDYSLIYKRLTQDYKFDRNAGYADNCS